MNIPAGEFKAKCLKLMDEVNENHQEITITKHGKPVAKLIPIENTNREYSVYGCMKNTAEIVGDILEPYPGKWDANQ